MAAGGARAGCAARAGRAAGGRPGWSWAGIIAPPSQPEVPECPLSGDPSWDIAPMMNNVAYNELYHRREGVPSKLLERDRNLLDGFWEAYPGGVAEESLLAAQLVQAVLQAEHRQDRLRHGQADTVEVEVSYEFIRATVDWVAA